MTAAPAPTLMAFWLLHRDQCRRSVSDIVADARAGKLPGVTPLPSGVGFMVTDEKAALAAMKGN
jgi:hypothetical protein